MNLKEMINKYNKQGYSADDSISKVSQDIILYCISKSKFKQNITIKGGVIMHNISHNKRRATQDLDLDFIKYSLSDDSIINFINSLNNDEIKIKIISKIEELNQQDYKGKRIYILLTDNYKFEIKTKLDIGVHKYFNIEQDEYCFDFNLIDDDITLLINSKEQIFTEKLKSLLRFGITSTRYKDIFDFYYLIENENLNKDKLLKCFNILIFEDSTIYENNINDIEKRVMSVLSNKQFLNRINNSKKNWIDEDIYTVTNTIKTYISTLSIIKV